MKRKQNETTRFHEINTRKEKQTIKRQRMNKKKIFTRLTQSRI